MKLIHEVEDLRWQKLEKTHRTHVRLDIWATHSLRIWASLLPRFKFDSSTLSTFQDGN